jgi:hypothetical protein
MNAFMSLYLALLFVAFVPGVLVTLPKGGSKMTVVAVHAVLFTLEWHFTKKMVWRMSEGFQNNSPMMDKEEEGFQDEKKKI